MSKFVALIGFLAISSCGPASTGSTLKETNGNKLIDSVGNDVETVGVVASKFAIVYASDGKVDVTKNGRSLGHAGDFTNPVYQLQDAGDLAQPLGDFERPFMAAPYQCTVYEITVALRAAVRDGASFGDIGFYTEYAPARQKSTFTNYDKTAKSVGRTTLKDGSPAYSYKFLAVGGCGGQAAALQFKPYAERQSEEDFNIVTRRVYENFTGNHVAKSSN